jgi:hypothetical protein
VGEEEAQRCFGSDFVHLDSIRPARPNPYSRKIRNACGSEEAANVRKTRSIRVITLPLLSVVSSAPMRCESRRSSSTLDSARKRLHTGLTNVF